MCSLVDAEPTCFKEATKKKEWMDAMLKEYKSIITNDVWDMVPRTREKSIVSSIRIFNIKHSVYGSIE